MRSIVAALIVACCVAQGIAGEFVVTPDQAAVEGLWFGRGNIDRYVLVIDDDQFAIANRAGTETSMLCFLDSPKDAIWFELTRSDDKKQLGVIAFHGKTMEMRLSFANGPQPKTVDQKTGRYYQFRRTPSPESLTTLNKKLVWPKANKRRFVFDEKLSALRVDMSDLRYMSDEKGFRKIENLDQLPKSIRSLVGKRVTTSGYMYPPPKDSGLTSFTITAERIITDFGRSRPNDRFLEVQLKSGVTTSYNQFKRFRVVGEFEIEHSKEHGEVYFRLTEARLIED